MEAAKETSRDRTARKTAFFAPRTDFLLVPSAHPLLLILGFFALDNQVQSRFYITLLLSHSLVNSFLFARWSGDLHMWTLNLSLTLFSDCDCDNDTARSPVIYKTLSDVTPLKSLIDSLLPPPRIPC
ncbi:hypothetical protein VTL71DRAFT_7861 [Oculimacula yallundae]|uniref:Uncharacterized protein n=1 Tax=Oculimacula yallundae TaxID=86028 RepID=A0ABR4CWB6_9HELO